MIRRVLPFAAAALVPSAIFALVYLTQGESPAYGLVAGAIGLLGALAAELVRLAEVVVARRRMTDLDRYLADPNATVLLWTREIGDRTEDVDRDELARSWHKDNDE